MKYLINFFINVSKLDSMIEGTLPESKSPSDINLENRSSIFTFKIKTSFKIFYKQE